MYIGVCQVTWWRKHHLLSKYSRPHLKGQGGIFQSTRWEDDLIPQRPVLRAAAGATQKDLLTNEERKPELTQTGPPSATSCSPNTKADGVHWFYSISFLRGLKLALSSLPPGTESTWSPPWMSRWDIFPATCHGCQDPRGGAAALWVSGNGFPATGRGHSERVNTYSDTHFSGVFVKLTPLIRFFLYILRNLSEIGV